MTTPNPNPIYVETTACDFDNPDGLTGCAQFDTLTEALDYAWTIEQGGFFGVASIAYNGNMYIEAMPADFDTREGFIAYWEAQHDYAQP